MKGKKGYMAKWLILAAILLSGCSGDSTSDITSSGNKTEININAEVWRMMEGTRATFFDSGTQSSGGFTCTAYTENTTGYNLESDINACTVVWSGGHWEFGSHRWPNSDALDFFAYMPQYDSKPSYISSITYAVSGEPDAPAPSFVCNDLPMTYNSASPTAGQGNGLNEFVWAMTIGQNKTNQGESGVTMKFRHPFARIKFQLAANNPNITINSITLKGLNTGGTCTFTKTGIAASYYYTTSSWSSLSGNSDFVMTLSSYAATFNNNPASAVPIGGYADSQHTGVDLIMIPQSWAGAIDVNVTWDDWGTPKTETLSTTAATTWQPGYSYTYTFTISKYALIVNTEKFTEQW